jgi:hypothetical protein
MGLICCLVPAVARRWPERLSRFGLGATWLGVAVFALLALTYTSRWSSSTEVWRGGVDRYPDVALALEHEALGLVADGRMAEANPMFLRMAERYPDWSDTFTDEVVAYEAAGDAASATRILLRGVRQGEPGCVRMFWMRVVYAPSSLGRLDRAVTAIAFDRGRSEMFERLHDPAALVRIAAALRSVGLDDDAARVDEHLAGLKGGG